MIFLGGKQAGCIGLLTAISQKYDVRIVVAYDKYVENLAKVLNILTVPRISNIASNGFDYILSVHGREILPNSFLQKSSHGGINIHPCLDKYKGEPTSPITRLLQNHDTHAAIGAHVMTETLDGGPIICMTSVEVHGRTEDEVYNSLYPYYPEVIIKAMKLHWGNK